MKLKIADPDLVRLLTDRIKEVDADGLCYMAEEILGLTRAIEESVEYDSHSHNYSP